MHQDYDDDGFKRLLESMQDAIDDMGADAAEYRNVLREGERILKALQTLKEKRKELDEQQEMMLGYVFAYRLKALSIIKGED